MADFLWRFMLSDGEIGLRKLIRENVMDRLDFGKVVCIALVWAYLVGEHKDINIKPIRILKHGRKAKSLVKYGLEEIAAIILRPTYTPKFDVFKFLSCRTFVQLNVFE